MQAVLCQLQHAHVQGRLRQAGEIHAHRLHALRQRQQRVQHDIGGRRTDSRADICLSTRERNAVIAAGKFIFQRRIEGTDERRKLRSPAGVQNSAVARSIRRLCILRQRRCPALPLRFSF